MASVEYLTRLDKHSWPITYQIAQAVQQCIRSLFSCQYHHCQHLSLLATGALLQGPFVMRRLVAAHEQNRARYSMHEYNDLSNNMACGEVPYDPLPAAENINRKRESKNRRTLRLFSAHALHHATHICGWLQPNPTSRRKRLLKAIAAPRPKTCITDLNKKAKNQS